MYPPNTYGNPPSQPDNPTNEDRYNMARYALAEAGRVEDLGFIIANLSPPPNIGTIVQHGALRGVKVGVIGAGLAGLSSAFELRKLGCSIKILEADPNRIGGRVYTYCFDRNRNLYGEFGAMRIPVTHETLWHYINLFRLPTSPFVQRNENAIINLHGISVRNDPNGINVMKYIYPHYNLSPWERKTSWQRLLYMGLDSHLLNASPEVRSELIQVKPNYNPIIDYWDSQNNGQMMRRAGLSEGAVDILSSLSPLAGSNLYNSYIDIAQANYPVNLSFLYEIPGGTSNLPMAFCNSFHDEDTKKYYPDVAENDLGEVSVELGAWVTGISRNSKGKVLLTYKLREGSFVREAFDYVICAIPFSSLRTADIYPRFTDMKMRAIREVNYIASQKTLFLCNRRFWEDGDQETSIFGGGSYTDLPISTIWYPSDGSCANCYDSTFLREGTAYSISTQPGVLIASYNYGLDTVRLSGLPKDASLREIEGDVEKVQGLLPGSLNGIVEDCKRLDWNREPTIRGALCFFSPEQKRLFSYVMSTPEYDGKVFFAGEHISATHRWMQGSLKSGMEAANQLAYAYKIE